MALDVKISYSWKDYCRLCLLDSGIMLPLFEEDGLNRQLSDKIQTCLQIVTYDGDPLPRRICHKCLYKLNQMHEFRTMALESLQRLKVHLLPLRHIPAVQQYLDKANIIPKTEIQDEYSNSNGSPTKSPTLAKDLQTLVSTNSALPSLRVKREEELLASKDSTSDSLSLSQSPPDSTSVVPKVQNPLSGKSMVQSRTRRSKPVKGKRNLKQEYLSGNSEVSSENLSSLRSSRNREPKTLPSLEGQINTPFDESEVNHDQNYDSTFSRPGPSFTKMKRKKKYVGSSTLRPVCHSTQWQCVFCDAHFLNKTALTLHMDMCLTCATCSQEFTSLVEKARHEADFHLCVFVDAGKSQMRKRCTFCPARFVSNVMLSMHVKYDHKLTQATSVSSADSSSSKIESPEQITFDAQSTDKSELSHSFQDDGKVEDILKRKYDDVSCSSDSDSNDRALASKGPCKKKASVEVEGTNCTKCARVFHSAQKLKYHIDNHNIMVHACHVCGCRYSSASRMRQHLKYHKKSTVQYKCKYCNETFESKGILYLHKKVHTNVENRYEKPQYVNKNSKSKNVNYLTCVKCHEQFLDDDALMLHLYQHATEPLSSEGSKSNEPETLRELKSNPPSDSVIQTCETTSENLSLRCEHCNLVCHSKDFYKIHVSKHTNKSKCLFPCSGCDQEFRNMEALTRHTCSGKQEANRHTCCLDCGQALIEGEEHECDNRCPKCKKVFRSARGQRLHSIYKHGNGVSSDFDQHGNQELPLSTHNDTIVVDDIDQSLVDTTSSPKVESCDDLEMGSSSLIMADFAPSAVEVHDIVELPQGSPILVQLLNPQPPLVNPFCLYDSNSYVSDSTALSNKSWHSPVSNPIENDNSNNLQADTSAQQSIEQ